MKILLRQPLVLKNENTMKYKIKIFMSFIILIIPFFTFSQKELRLNYNSMASGMNFSITYGIVNSQENEIGIGIRYNINSLKHPDDQFNSYYKRLFATKFLHFVGIEAFFHQRVIKKWKIVKPFLFFNSQVSYSTTRNRSFLPVGYDANGDVLYKEFIDIFGPYLWIEPNIGIGYNAILNKHFFITSKLGFEVMLLNGEDKKRLNAETFIREFGYSFSFSVGYRFKSQKFND